MFGKSEFTPDELVDHLSLMVENGMTDNEKKKLVSAIEEYKERQQDLSQIKDGPDAQSSDDWGH